MKKLIFSIAFASLALGASAQVAERYDTTQGTYEVTNKKGPYLTGRFLDNTFIGVAGGVNIYNGEGDNEADFEDRLAPQVELSLGKWLTPVTAIRLQGSWGQVKGLSGAPTHYTKDWAGKDGYQKHFNVWTAHADVMINASNWIGGYREDRTWDVIPFIGMGGAWSDKGCRSEFEFAGFAGLVNNFRLGDVVDLNIEAKYMFVKSGFDRYADKKWDGMTSVTAGLAFKLGPKQGFKRPGNVVVADYTPYQNRINSLEKQLNDANAKAAKLNKDLQDCLNRPVQTTTTTVINNNEVPSSVNVFFPIGSTKISTKDMVNVKNMAEAIKANPEKKYTVTGYADNATGTPALNEKLSRQRAEAVKAALVSNGVKAEQLEVSAKGGVSNHSEKALDRVVVIE